MDEREIYEAWYAEWLAADYSWEGLAKKNVEGLVVDGRGRLRPGWSGGASRVATLQDVWRSEEKYLIKGPGGSYTRFHVPLIWEDGSPSPKARWNRRHALQFRHRLYVVLNRIRAINRMVARNDIGFQILAPISGFVFPKSFLFSNGDVECLSKEELDLSHIHINCPISLIGEKFPKILSIRDSLFSAPVEAHEVEFGADVDLDNSSFNSNLNLFLCKFQGDLTADGARSSCDITIVQCNFSEIFRLADAKFEKLDIFSSKFCEIAGSRLIANSFSLNRSSVSGVCWLIDMTISGDVSVSETEFSKSASFSGSELKGRVVFINSTFKAQAMFNKIRLSDNFRSVSAMFIGARFDDAAYFQEFQPDRVAAFAGPMFKRPPVFSPDFIDKLTTERVCGAATSGGDSENQSRSLLNRKFKILEEAIGNIKSQADSAKRRDDGYKLYRVEMCLQKRRMKKSSVAWISHQAYEACADYGLSIMRPLYTLIVLFVIFSAIFHSYYEINRSLLCAECITQSWSTSIDGSLTLSLRNIFKPFSIWEGVPSKGAPWLGEVLAAGGILGHGWIRVLSSLESVLAATCLFLSGLAAKRRFQLS